MRPKHLIGDMVTVCPPGFAQGSEMLAMVISVQQANEIPDAAIRGLAGLQAWHYWVLMSESNKVAGPLSQDWVDAC